MDIRESIAYDYSILLFSIRQICEKYSTNGCAVRKILSEMGVPSRKRWDHPNHRKEITEEFLYNAYVVERRVVKDICKEVDCCVFTFNFYRKKYGIDKRSATTKVKKIKIKKQPISVTHPHLLPEWNYDKNRVLGFDPEVLTYGSHERVWWLCGKAHEYDVTIKDKCNKNSGCPYCTGQKAGYGNDLLTNHPVRCKEWHPTKNKLGPENYTPGSHEKVWWLDSKGHEWDAIIYNRVLFNTGCPYCSGNKVGYGNDLLTNYPELCIASWDYNKNVLGPENYTSKSNKKVWWICGGGHSCKSPICNRVSGFGCKKCSRSVSKVSQKWLDELGVEQREVLVEGLRVDGYDPKTKTVYEFLGDLWHGNPKVYNLGDVHPVTKKSFADTYKRTFQRFTKLENAGYKVVYVWESDFKKY